MSEDATTEVGLFGNDMLELDVAFSGLEVAQVEGRFGHRMLDLGDTLDIEGVAALQDLQVGWTALEWEVVFHNTAGLDLLLQLEGLSRLDSGEVVVVSIWEGEASFHPNDLVIKERTMKGIIAYRHVYPAVMALMQRGYFRAEDMVTQRIPLADIVEEGFEALLSDKAQVKIIVTP